MNKGETISEESARKWEPGRIFIRGNCGPFASHVQRQDERMGTQNVSV